MSVHDSSVAISAQSILSQACPSLFILAGGRAKAKSRIACLSGSARMLVALSVALFAYFVVQRLIVFEKVSALLPNALKGWLPALSALLAFIILSNIQLAGDDDEDADECDDDDDDDGAQNKNRFAAILGQEAPDFSMQMKGHSKMKLRDFIRESKLPTLVEFYQNF